MDKLFKAAVRLFMSPWVRWSVFLSWLGVLLIVALKPTPPSEVFANSDKFGHAFAFIGLAVFGKLAMWRLPVYVLWPLLFGFAIALEYFQGAWRPLRVFSLGDAYSNVLGVAIGILAAAVGAMAYRSLAAREADPTNQKDS